MSDHTPEEPDAAMLAALPPAARIEIEREVIRFELDAPSETQLGQLGGLVRELARDRAPRVVVGSGGVAGGGSRGPGLTVL